MFIVFRVDASSQMGTGHVIRCLTLAGKLSEAGVEVAFICRVHAGHLCKLIERSGYKLIRLELPTTILSPPGSLIHSQWLGLSQEEDAQEVLVRLAELGGCDWLIVDHYGLDVSWEAAMRPFAKYIMVIDDLADRKHDCDLLIDQNFYFDDDKRYNKLVSNQCIKLLGPSYAMLRPEFLNCLPKAKQRISKLNRILVYFGGSDSGNETLKALQAIKLLNNQKLAVDVILGVNFLFKSCVLDFSSRMKQVKCHDYVDNIAEFMTGSDLYLGAAGITTWERCCIGLPSIVIAVSSNQVLPMEQLERSGIVRFLGERRNVSVDDIFKALVEFMSAPSIMREMSLKAMKLVDGKGAQRCVKAILNNGEIDEKAI
jgi:UDP-2,4-diacetamido-2,4,6-trideoxy-beta-L-altropyranose hydrolase